MNGSIPSPDGTPYADGSQLDRVTRCTVHDLPPSPLPRYVTSNNEFPLQLRSLVIRSMRPVVGSTLISTLMRSPDDGATMCGALHWPGFLTLAEVSRI